MAESINPLKIIDSLVKTTGQVAKQDAPKVPFDTLLKQAIMKDPNIVQAAQGAGSYSDISKLKGSDLLAQVFPNQQAQQAQQAQQIQPIQEEESAKKKIPKMEMNMGDMKLEISPFQVFIDRAIEGLESISDMERHVNDLMEQYIQGRASIDEVSIETTKLNLAISFASSVITSATQTLKEITQMAI